MSAQGDEVSGGRSALGDGTVRAQVRIAAPPPMIPPSVEVLGVKAFTSLREALDGADVVMALRIQSERLAGSYFPSVREYSATFGLDRVFDNGWSVGAFFTLTDVPAEKFGEGSFDKGIRFSMPVAWALGQPSRATVGTTVTPITRDGGQRLNVPGRLYPQIRGAHRKALSDQAVRFWQ